MGLCHRTQACSDCPSEGSARESLKSRVALVLISHLAVGLTASVTHPCTAAGPSGLPTRSFH